MHIIAYKELKAQTKKNKTIENIISRHFFLHFTMNFINDEKISQNNFNFQFEIYMIIATYYLFNFWANYIFFVHFYFFWKFVNWSHFFHFVHFISPKMARRCKSAVMQSQKFLQKMVPPQFKSLTQARSVLTLCVKTIKKYLLKSD